MRSLGNTSSASFQSGFDSGSLGGFDAVESVIGAEIDDAPLESSLSSQSPSEHLESGSIETLNPTSTQPLPIEDPIEAYDSLVSRMATDGVEWIPPNQIAKGFPDGLSLHDNPAQWQNGKGPDDVTTPTKVQEEVTLSEARQTPHPAESSELSNRTAFVQHPSTDANDVGVSENVSKLRELQFQLNQEKATRKHQEDYIQQLQRYYDNLLAKHAAAEMTIDHLRIRAKVGCEDSTPPLASSTTPGNTFSNTLRGRKLTSASLDTCVPALLSKRSHQPRVSGSVASFRDHSTPTRSQCSLNPNSRVSMQPQVHLMPLASSSKHSQRSRLNDGLERPKSGLNNAPNGEGTVASVDDSTDFEGVANRPVASVDLATQNAAKSLEDQLNASLVAIHERLDAIEARCLNNHRKEAIAAAFHDLEDLRRRYQAGQYLWSGDGLFDSQAVIGTCLDRLLQRVQQVEERMADNDGSDTTPPRPSSLSLVNSHRPSSANANRNVITTAATGINLSPTDLYLERSSSPPASVYQRAADAATTAVSTDSREAAEAHFSRLLARYNKLKVVPGHWKDIESLMQRMLQLSDRYSAYSSVMLPPKSLRRMFESDYGINNVVNQAVIPKSSVQTCSQFIPPKTMKDASIMPRQMLSPDSGVPQTPLGSSGSSGVSCYSTAGPRNGFIRQKPIATVAAASNEAPTDSQRKHSDSGFWATDTCSAVVPSPSPFKGDLAPSSSDTTTNTDELDVDNNISRPSKMLPDEVMSLEADILRLRKGIARLTSTASVSAPRCCESGAGSGSSNSTYLGNPPRKKLQRPLNSVNASTSSRVSKSSGHSSASMRQPRLPTSSSSSDEDAAYSTFNRPRYPSRSRHRVAAVNNSNDAGPTLEVIGSSLTPQQRTSMTGQTRTYYHTSSRPHFQSSRNENCGHRRTDAPIHRRSHSSTGQRVFYHPCSSCGGSGYNLNTIGRFDNEAFDSSVHSRNISDSFSMPARVIYEYRQTPTIRLPVQQDCSGWTERVYGMQELYGSALSPQPGRAYNTIGHQPSTTSLKRWSNHSRCSWTPGKSTLLPATSSPLIPQRANRRTRQYVHSQSQSLSHDGTTSSSSEDEARGAVGVSTSSCFCNHHRHRSSSRQVTELDDFSSASSGAYAAARCVTQMAQRLNNKLSRHQDRHRTPVRQPQHHQRLSSHPRSSRSSHQDGDNSSREDF